MSIHGSDEPEKGYETVSTGCSYSDAESVPQLSIKLDDLSRLVNRIENIGQQVTAVLNRLRGEIPQPVTGNKEVTTDRTIVSDFNASLSRLDQVTNELENNAVELSEYI